MTDLDQAETNAREILELTKSGAFHELKDERIRCSCRLRDGQANGPTLARFFMGPDDSTGKSMGWVWVPTVDAAGEKMPPTATIIPLKAGEAGWTLISQCGECRNTWLVFPTGPPSGLTGKWPVISYRPDKSASEPARVGDRTITGQATADHMDGPGPLVMVRLDDPTWGRVAPSE